MDEEHLLPKGQDALTSVAVPDVEPARVIDVSTKKLFSKADIKVCALFEFAGQQKSAGLLVDETNKPAH